MYRIVHAGAFVIGIVTGVLYKEPSVFWVGFLCAIVIFFSRYIMVSQHSVKRAILVGLLFMGGFLYAAIYYEIQNPKILRFYYNQSVSIVGTVTDIREQWSGSRAVINTHKINNILIINPEYEKVLVTLSPGNRVSIGDTVSLYGDMREPEDFISDTGVEFYYKTYLSTEHIHGLISPHELTVTGKDSGFLINFKRHLFSFRRNIREQIQSVFPLPVSALFSGIMIGDQSLFPDELTDVFRKTGLIHIMVLSGSNIALIAGFTYVFTRRYGFYRRYIFTGAIVTVFVMMTGFTPPSVRALIMVLAGYVSRVFLREKTSEYVFLLTIAVMLCIEPLLIKNISFVLSLLATFAVVFIAPRVDLYITGITNKFGIREILSQTLATQAIVVPYTVVTMGMFSIAGIPLNIIVLPIIGLLTVAGYFITTISFISQGVAIYFSLPLAYLGAFIIWISKSFANIPYAFLYTSSISKVFLLFYYLFLLGVYVYLSFKKSTLD